MRGAVQTGLEQIQVLDVPDPVGGEGMAIVKVRAAGICGSDLHILKGDVPTCAPGRVLGHEGVGVVEEVGESVSQFKPGDRVLISCITSCGKCDYCKKGMYSHCASGGWILGHKIDGTQAEYVRIPHADTSLYHIPPQPKVDLHLERLWSHNITLRTRLVDTVSTPMLLRTVQTGKIDPHRLITHYFKMAEILSAYDTFSKAADNQALKVIIDA